MFISIALTSFIVSNSFGMNTPNECPTLKKQVIKTIDIENIDYEQANIPQELKDDILTYKYHKQAVSLKNNLLSKNNNNYLKALINGIKNLINEKPQINSECLDLLTTEGKIDPKATLVPAPSYRHMQPGTLLSIAAIANNRPVIKLLCNKYAVPVDEQEVDKCGTTPLMWASKAGQIDAIKTLLNLGANINHPNFIGRTPLFYVQSPETLKLLIELGANVNVKDQFNETFLMHLLTDRPNQLDFVEEILKHPHNNFSLTNSAGETVLDLAKKSKNRKLISLIKQAIKNQSEKPIFLRHQNSKKGLQFLI